jgi:PAS domain S-box-containing protein
LQKKTVNKLIRILIVEDDPTDAFLMERELRKGGMDFEASCVETEQAFVVELTEHPPDVILSDHGLPAFDGFAALAIAKRRLPEVPFIFVTGSLGEETAIETFKGGASDYVLKSRLANLAPAVLRALNQARERRLRRQAEEELQRSEQCFRTLVESVRDYAIYMLDRSGHVATWNSGAERIEGYNAEEIIGQHFSIFFTPDEIERDRPREILEIASREGRFHYDGWRLRKDGTRFWAQIVFTSVCDANGNTTGFSKVARDMTEQKRAEEELRCSEQRFRRLVEGVQDYAICMLDAEGRVVSWNTASERIEGYRPEDIVGRHFSYVFSSEDKERGKPEEALERARSRGRFEGEVWLVRKDGTGYWANVVLTPLRDADGRITGFSEVIRDVTERKRHQEQLRRFNAELERRVVDRTAQLESANRELESFSYSVSHDLRAPLRHIDGFVEMLQRTAGSKLDSECSTMLRVISDAAKKMDHLIEDLLTFSRMGRSEMLSTRVDMASLVEKVRVDLREDERGRNVVWKVEPLPKVEGDPALLKQSWMNLLSNALKYSRPKPVAEIQVGCHLSDDEHTFFVRDNGVGFDPQYASKLFGVFQRLHAARDFEGTGIGLAIVRRIIARHGGRTWAESKPGEGATFYFTLPSRGVPVGETPK